MDARETERILREATETAPQPVAIAAGSIIRARSATEHLDAILRCGEVLARYLATISLASFAARERLARQVLVEKRKKRYHLRDDLVAIAEKED